MTNPMNQSETTSAVGGVTLIDLHAANIARQAEWCPDQLPDLSFRGNELAGETGEACNVIKKLERERQGWRGSRATKEQLAEELADVVICADLCAVTAGIDLDAAVREKFNATSEKVGLTTKLAAPTAKGGTEVRWEDVSEGAVVQVIAAYREARRKYGATSEEASVARGCLYNLEELCRSIAASPPPPAGAAGGSDVMSARLIPWEPGQQGVEITLTGGRSVAIPLSQSAGAAGGGSGDLGALSAGASKGPWHVDMFPYRDIETGESEPPQCEGICTHDDEGGLADSIATCNEREAKFIVALVNAYRSGRLIEAPTPDLGTQGEPVAIRDRYEHARAIAEAAANHWDQFGDTAGVQWLAEQIYRAGSRGESV